MMSFFRLNKNIMASFGVNQDIVVLEMSLFKWNEDTMSLLNAITDIMSLLNLKKMRNLRCLCPT